MLLREVASEGICKLLLSHRISSQKLLAKLLLLWYNPITKEETELRSVLGLFFLSFASLDRSGGGGRGRGEGGRGRGEVFGMTL